MSITVEIPSVVRSCCGGASELFVTARTVRGVLEQIEDMHPALYLSVCDETGAVRRHVNLFVNSSLLRDRDRLDTMLADGDIVNVFQAVSGG